MLLLLGYSRWIIQNCWHTHTPGGCCLPSADLLCALSARWKLMENHLCVNWKISGFNPTACLAHSVQCCGCVYLFYVLYMMIFFYLFIFLKRCRPNALLYTRNTGLKKQKIVQYPLWVLSGVDTITDVTFPPSSLIKFKLIQQMSTEGHSAELTFSSFL